MTDGFFRFPRTPHLAWLGDGSPRDDKLLSATEVDALLAGPVVVEEKLDGANLGFSLTPDGTLRAQNRGTYLQAPFAGQFKRLAAWLAQHERPLAETLGNDLIAFGEWCAARHTLGYDRLPDWWLLFDVYDRREGRFWSTKRRDRWAVTARVAVVPVLHRGDTNLTRLREWATTERSHYRDGPLEGVVVRSEDADWSNARGKLVIRRSRRVSKSIGVAAASSGTGFPRRQFRGARHDDRFRRTDAQGIDRRRLRPAG